VRSNLTVQGQRFHRNQAPTTYYEDTNHGNFIQHVNQDRMYFMFDRDSNQNWEEGDNDRVVMYGDSA
jgi:hypothetical protein